MSIFSDMVSTQKENTLVLTENGALMHGTSGHALLDMNFDTTQLNRQDGAEIYSRFHNALEESPAEAFRWLFYLRDCRGGMGLRNSFQEIMIRLLDEYPQFTKAFLELTPEYGYWKDLRVMYEKTSDTNLKKAIVEVYAEQLSKDIDALLKDESVSLAGKYAPTDTSKIESNRKMANDLMEYMGIDRAQYRKMTRNLRKKIDVVEKRMSVNDWKGIDYQAVPSKANLRYSEAFRHHDAERFEKHIEAVNKGEEKRNVGQNFPHEILGQARIGAIYRRNEYKSKDDVVEANWKSYPRENLGRVMIVEDRSGSMGILINDSYSAREVADSLALLFSEQMTGEFKNTFITFSNRPEIRHLGGGTVLERLQNLHRYTEVADTNIEAVFDLILKTAKRGNYTQGDMPETILILSDMEFNAAQGRRCRVDETLFETIATKYEDAGYKLPRLVFWNLNGRTGGIPVRENELGVALVSGYSPSILKMVLAGNTDPWKNLQDCLNIPRYDAVEEAVVRSIASR